jgi:hypothetical protein
MNAPFPKPEVGSGGAAKEDPERKKLKRKLAQREVDEWRGSCVRYFADLEQGLVETFDALAETRATESVSDPGFIAGRLSRLIELAGEAPNHHGGRKLAQHLVELQSQLHLRVLLTHGSGKVRLDPRGKWRITLRYRPPKGASEERLVLQDQAEESLNLLSTEVPKAVQRMGAFVRASKPNSRRSDPVDTPSA